VQHRPGCRADRNGTDVLAALAGFLQVGVLRYVRLDECEARFTGDGRLLVRW
jgi:hypothetical protein